jgi:hypothetical protein
MSDGERSVRSTLLMSYRQLGADAARAFRLLGTIDATQLTTDAAGAAMGAPRRTAEQVLDTIVNAALLSARADDCYESITTWSGSSRGNSPPRIAMRKPPSSGWPGTTSRR